MGNHLFTLSSDFGLKEFNVPDAKERIRRYRRYMYEAGTIDRPGKGRVQVIDPRVLAAQKKKGLEISKAGRLRCRTRYFTDSGIIGSKEFVSKQRLKSIDLNRGCMHFRTRYLHHRHILFLICPEISLIRVTCGGISMEMRVIAIQSTVTRASHHIYITVHLLILDHAGQAILSEEQ